MVACAKRRSHESYSFGGRETVRVSATVLQSGSSLNKKRSQSSKPSSSVERFRAESGVALESGDVYLEPTGLVGKGARHRLSLKRTKTQLAVVCEPFSYRTTNWITGGIFVAAAFAITIGAIIGAEFANGRFAFLLVLSLLGYAAVAYGLKWVENRNIRRNHPLIVFDSQAGVVSLKNGQMQIDRDDVHCLMQMNSRARKGKAETTVFQLKLVTTAYHDGRHKAVLLLQNGSLPLDYYHEQLVPFARSLKIPLVECEYDFREFRLKRVA